MKYWVQFLTLSTGYIPGTIPPQFGKPELIDALGSDGVFILDGRNSSENMRRDARIQAWRLQNVKRFEGFRICCGPRLFEERRRGPIHKLEYPIAGGVGHV